MRFRVETYESPREKYYAVIDEEANKWSLPVRAVAIYFATFEHAEQVSDLLNKEWTRFLRNPK